MKKIILLLAFLCSVSFYGQNEVAAQVNDLVSDGTVFKSFSVLNAVSGFADKQYQRAVDNATVATINNSALDEILRSRLDYIELAVPYNNNMITVQLFKVNPFAEGFHVETSAGETVNFSTGVYYRGMIKGDDHSVVSFNFFNSEMNGIISNSQLGNVVVGRLDKAGNKSDYIVYSDVNFKIPNNFSCSTDETNHTANKSGNEIQSTESVKCVKIYYEIDYSLYTQNGSNVFNVTNWMVSVFNNVQTLMANDGISIALKSILIWTSPSPYSGTSSGDFLDQFTNQRGSFDGDAAQLIGIFPGGLGGVAWFSSGTLCGSLPYSFADADLGYATVPTYSWTVEVSTHEFGHTFGSNHTHACAWNGNNTAIDNCYTLEGGCPAVPNPSPEVKGTIMSYCHLIPGIGISFNNGFGPQPKARILNFINSKPCLTTDCYGACINRISGINFTQLTPDSVQLTWQDSNSTTQWEVAVALADDPFPFSDIVNVKNYTAEGLIPGAQYRVTIRPICQQNLTAAITEYFFTNGSLGIKESTEMDFSYYPNPAKDFVAITSKDEIDEISVYNIEGRLLYQSKTRTSNAKIDISAYAAGTYFFKLKGEGKESNFKIIKM